MGIVEFQKGDFHVIIKISDQGGGMPKPVQKQVWQYGWTSVADGSSGEEDREMTPLAWKESGSWRRELAGYGFGLPLTRLHAQYFGGDVFIQALPGHGTDMYLLLNHLKEGTRGVDQEDLST